MKPIPLSGVSYVMRRPISRMILSRSIKLFTLSLVIAVCAVPAFAQKPSKPPIVTPGQTDVPDPNKGLKPPSGPSFYIGPVEGSPGYFSVLMGVGTTTVAGSFSLHQVEVFEAVLESALDFAMNEEGVGKTTATVTRLMDQHEWSLFVDVSKLGDRSKFYVTLITPHGRLTTEAGEIIRSKKEQSALLMKMISQIQEVKAAAH